MLDGLGRTSRDPKLNSNPKATGNCTQPSPNFFRLGGERMRHPRTKALPTSMTSSRADLDVRTAPKLQIWPFQYRSKRKN
jgi:hypothetical protein